MLLYAVSGDHFAFGSRITWSLMPDGTNLGGNTSNLVSTLNSKLGTGTWQAAFQDAFAQWEKIANVNFAQVPDDGSPFGASPFQQGAPNVGDIRIGGFVEAGNTLAFTMLPPIANGGSDAGDVLLNTALQWNVGSNYDLETVMIHEIGHALGMGHSANVNAAMYPYYGGVQIWLDPDDVAGVQSIWGARHEDPIEQQSGNLTMAKAANVNGFMNAFNGQVYLPGLDVANVGETYWFKVTTPAFCSPIFTAQVQSTNLSELSPRVSIFNAAGAGLVQTSAAANSYGATINATINFATPYTTYYVRVQGSNAGDTGTGNYALTINTGFQFIGNASPPNTVVFAQPDQGGGFDTMTAGGLGSWVKDWVNSGETIDFSSLGVQYDPQLITSLSGISHKLKADSSNALKSSEAAAVAILQQMPTAVDDGSETVSGAGGTATISVSSLESILSAYLNDLLPRVS